MKSVESSDSNDPENSNDRTLTTLLQQLSQLKLQSKVTLDRIEAETNQLRNINNSLEAVVTAINDYTTDRVLVNTAEIDHAELTPQEEVVRRYKALIPKHRTKYNAYASLEPCTTSPVKGDLVVILNKYKSATDKKQQQGIIGAVQSTDQYRNIWITVQEGVTYQKAWRNCALLIPTQIEYEKEFPITPQLWSRLMN